MKRRSWTSALVGLIATATLGAAGCDFGHNSSLLFSPLEPIGGTLDAKGSLTALLSDDFKSVELELEGLAPGREYEVRADGVTVLVVSADALGNLDVSLTNQAVDFDPRGRVITVSDDSGPLLEASFTHEAESSGAIVDERARLVPSAVTVGEAKTRFRIRPDGRRSFSVELEDVPDGSYEVVVGGIVRGAIQVMAGQGEIEFDTSDPPKPFLDFDPREMTVEVRRDGQIVFSGPAQGGIDGLEECTPDEIEELLAPSAGGKAKVRLRTEGSCDRDLRVEIENVPAGDYELRVGGVVRATIPVVFDPVEGQLEGEAEFDSRPGEDPFLLDFDVLGQPIEILSAGEVVFSTTAFGAGGAGAPAPGPACEESEIEIALVPTASPAGSGEARLRVRDDCRESFRVEIEDLPMGTYALRVGGIERGSILVGANEGELEFDTDDPPKPVLDFNPRGALIEVLQGGVGILQATFPMS